MELKYHYQKSNRPQNRPQKQIELKYEQRNSNRPQNQIDLNYQYQIERP